MTTSNQELGNQLVSACDKIMPPCLDFPRYLYHLFTQLNSSMLGQHNVCLLQQVSPIQKPTRISQVVSHNATSTDASQGASGSSSG